MSWSSKPQAQVWQTKSFASAIRGAAASGPPPGLGPSPNGLPSLHSVQQQPKPTEILNLTNNHFQQKLSQANISSHLKHLNDQHQIQVDKINEIMTLLKQLENMINDQTVSINTPVACTVIRECYQLVLSADCNVNHLMQF